MENLEVKWVQVPLSEFSREAKRMAILWGEITASHEEQWYGLIVGAPRYRYLVNRTTNPPTTTYWRAESVPDDEPYRSDDEAAHGQGRR